MIENGELEATPEDLQRIKEQEKEGILFDEHIRDKMHKSFRREMTHLTRQESRGKAGSGRKDEFFRIILLLVLLGIVVWFLYFRF